MTKQFNELEDDCESLKEDLEKLKTGAQASTSKLKIIGAPSCSKSNEIHEPCKKKKRKSTKKKNRIDKCYNCGVHGSMVASCKNGEIKLSHQKEQPKEKKSQVCMQRKSPSFWYNSPFYGYCFACNDSGHRAIDDRAHARNKNEINRRYQVIPQFLGHIRCFLCENVGHKAKDYKIPMCYRRSNQKQENMQGQPHKKKKDQQMTFWRRKEHQGSHTKN